ncbi:hypothetical protein W97_03641 [Coniosporium apollinis CBS 100218]|uniref:Uncharacterized protein n=1 Tax=Coniosporium apollinis (strain CBS 100218) TaxID=1168221 RepID=R7YR58_CONA1|nr:uncharacterized protein W97_03641 [Coniosporium apollinis CBS 100218]EON64410.1 hypothetical protein W97_03641 [Coniosporium apollinis CBS 100218]
MVTTRRGLDTDSPAAGTPANKPLPTSESSTIEITAKTATSKRKVEQSTTTPMGVAKRRRVYKIHARAKSNGAVHEKQMRVVEEENSNGSASGDGSSVEDGTAADTSDTIHVRPKSPEVVIEATSHREEHPDAARIPSTASASTPEQEPMYEHLATPATASVYATPATTLRTTQMSPARKTPVPEVPSSTLDSEMTEEASTPQPTRSRNTSRQPTASPTVSRNSAPPTASTANAGSSSAAPAGSPSSTEPTPKPSRPPPAPVPKSTHIRFGSEEPPPPASAPLEIPSSSQPSNADLPAGSDDASDDEAPETITTASALAAARAREQEAVRAAEQRDEAERKRRRERDERTRRQAEKKERRRERKEREKAKGAGVLELDAAAPAVDEVADDAAPALLHPPTKLDVNNLPALLPEELLAAAPEVRPPTPPPPAAAQAVARKAKHHRFLDADERPPKDVKRGPVSVRVLQQTNRLLAPKASANSRNLREAWLKGRQGLGRGGGKGGGKGMVGAKIERRAKKGGFLVG